jgi:hypothetical protein
MLNLLLLGTSFWTIGWTGDERGWWVNRPFLTNVVSSMATACFGIPFAVFVLQRLSSMQSVRATVLRSISRTLRSADRLLNGTTVDQFDNHLFGRLKLIETRIEVIKDPAYQGLPKARSMLDEMHEAILELGEIWRPSPEFGRHLTELRDDWRYVRENVPAKLLEAGLSAPRVTVLDNVDRCFDQIGADVEKGIVEWLNDADDSLRYPTSPLEVKDLDSFVTGYRHLLDEIGDLRAALASAAGALLRQSC